jgi:hypothetical protein
MLAFKVVGVDYRSMWAQPPLTYTVGRRVDPGRDGLFAYTTLERTQQRARMAGGPGHARVLALDYDHAQVKHTAEDGTVLLTGCRVAGEVPLIDAETWPRSPRLTIDLAPLLEEVARHVIPYHPFAHGVEHWRGTAAIAGRRGELTPDADPDVAAAFAILHDLRRRASDDPADGPLAAAYARELHTGGALGLTDAQLDKLCEAFLDYPPRRTEDPTLGVCWDACRLELRRVGVEIDQQYLSTGRFSRRGGSL